MNPQKHFLSFLGLSLIISFSGFTQDIHFSQHNLTPMLINPAQAEAYQNPEAIASYRTRNTVMFTYTNGRIRLKGKKWANKQWLATGLSVFSDKAGNSKIGTTQILTSLGYHTLLSEKSTLGGALFGGYVQRGKSGYPDVGVGLLYQYHNKGVYSTAKDRMTVHAGLALFHINSPQYSYLPSTDKLYMKMVGHADAVIRIKNTNFSLLSGVTYMQQDSSQEIYAGSFFRYTIGQKSTVFGFGKGISIGTHFRVNTINKNAFIPSLQFEILGYHTYTIGLSYDLNISDSATATSGKGGFEIHLRYRWPDLPLYTVGEKWGT